MDRLCLLVDIDGQGFAEQWQAQSESVSFALKLTCVSLDEAEPMLETGSVVALVIVASKSSPELLKLLEAYRKRIGAIASFQAIIAEDPDPRFLADVYEYGLETFYAPSEWANAVAALCAEIAQVLDDESSVEAKAINLSQSILSGDQGRILDAEKSFADSSSYDFLAAYSRGSACQAAGRFDEAIEAFRASRKMNKHFRPASAGLGENLLVTGKIDEAIEIFEQMERSNPRNVDRKAHLAAAYMEKGDPVKAEKYLAEAALLAPDHPRVAETKAQILLVSGKVNEAFQMMDNLSEVGPFFAAKLNEMGIKLSQAGKGKSALALYQKAHKIVKPELRYKISMNAALACHRLADFQMALKYLVRCEKEYGGTFEKLDKIRKAVKASLAKGGETQAAPKAS